MSSRQVVGQVVLAVLVLALVATSAYVLYQSGYQAGARSLPMAGMRFDGGEFGRGRHMDPWQVPFHRPGGGFSGPVQPFMQPFGSLPFAWLGSVLVVGAIGGGVVLALQWAIGSNKGSSAAPSASEAESKDSE